MAIITVSNGQRTYLFVYFDGLFRVTYIDSNGDSRPMPSLHTVEVANAIKVIRDAISAYEHTSSVGPAHTEPLPNQPPGDVKDE